MIFQQFNNTLETVYSIKSAVSSMIKEIQSSIVTFLCMKIRIISVVVWINPARVSGDLCNEAVYCSELCGNTELHESADG